jgi:hypothetical protein
MVAVAEVAELPDQLGTRRRRADRVEHRHQAAPTSGVDQEGFAIGVEQQRLATTQRQATLRLA